MTKTFQTQNTLQAKTMALLAAGFIGLAAIGAAPAFADNECTGSSNTRCGESRIEEEARLAEAERRLREANEPATPSQPEPQPEPEDRGRPMRAE